MKEESSIIKKIKIEEKTKINIKNNNKSCLVYSFGNNKSGEIGFEDKKQRNKPEQIISLNKKEIIQVTIGSDFTLFLSSNFYFI